MQVRDLAELIADRRAQSGSPIVVGISGYAGSGKSTLARDLVPLVPGSVRMRGDDFLDPARSHHRSSDWDGVERTRLVEEVLEPFRARRLSMFRRFDWSLRTLGPWEPIPVGEVMIVDLIGLFHPEVLDALDLTVWCDVDLETARVRGMQRDLALGRNHAHLWDEVWVPNERDFDARFEPASHAEIVVPTL